MPYTYRSGRPGASRRPTKNRRAPQNSRKRGYIDPARFIAAAKNTATSVAYEPKHQFSDFDVNPLIAANLQAKGYTTPSPIQDQAIPHGLAGRDVLGLASTGTGKTAAFAVPVLNKMMADPDSSAIIIAPTRELAEQIEAEFRSIGKGSRLMGALLIGGSSMRTQLLDLKAGARIIIGTPGRIKDHLERGTLKLDNFSIAVLDEVDRMLDMGFIGDIRHILSHMPNDRQSFFFSATITPAIRTLIDGFTDDPVTVKIESSRASENVHQDVIRYNDRSDKFAKLKEVLAHESVSKAIIFDETQRGVERLYKSLEEHGFAVDSMHGGKSQGQRQRALRKFKQSEVNFLVATDVAARGIDVADITHVINYSTPEVYDDYIHRIGRAGRAGKTGYSFTFVESRGTAHF